MDKIIENYMENNGSTSLSTRSTLKQGLKRLEKILHKNFDDIKITDFKNAEKTIDDISDLYSLNTTIGTVLAVI